jgi:uncharacterized membrane-anchored protein
MPKVCWRVAVAFNVVLLCGWAVSAQAQTSAPPDIEWQEGPGTGQIGAIAQINIPEGFRFAGKDGVRRFLELTENPSSGNELAVMVSPSTGGEPWFVIFEFNQIGYVKDDEKDQLDANAILQSIRSGTERANEERRKRGWAAMNILGWSTPPRYDAVTNNLTWAIRGSSEGAEVINHSVRLLGRKGVMDVDLVLGPGQVSTAVPAFDDLLSGFEFSPGSRYAEFRPGDRIAEYGLTALVAGGVGAAAAKSGLLGKLWKLLVVGFLAAVAAIKRAVASVFGSKKQPDEEAVRVG